MKYNWKPVIESIIKHVNAAGFSIKSVDNGDGDEFPKTVGEAIEMIGATDESQVIFEKNGKPFWVYIVLGNSPEETVCDYSVNSELEAALDEFSFEWEGKPCPISKS